MLPLPLANHSIRNINFEGSNVRVVMTYASGSSFYNQYNDIATGTANMIANIIFDYCGCTGSFFQGVVTAGHFYANPSQPSLYTAIRFWTTTGSMWDDGTIEFTKYVYNHRNVEFGPHIFRGGMQIANSGSYSFESDYTGLYELHYRFDISSGIFGPNSVVRAGAVADFSWYATLFLGDLNIGSVSGTVYATQFEEPALSTPGDAWRGFLPTVFFRAGERATFRIEYTIDNHGDALDTIGVGNDPLALYGTMYSGLFFHLLPPSMGSGDGSITYFRPLGITFQD